MEDILNIFIRSIFVENMIFAYFLGMCSYIAVSKDIKTSIGFGAAIVFMLVVTVPINYLMENYVLKEGALSWLGESFETVDLSFLSFIIFMAIIAAISQIVEMFIERFAPALYNALGIFLPLLAVQCAIMGASLFMQQKEFVNIGEATSYALGSGIGWLLGIVGLAVIREKMAYSNVPAPLRGLGITFIVVGLMAMAFMCFSGLDI